MLATPANMETLRIDAGEPIGCPGLFAYSPTTGERYSADAGDYWNRPADEPLRDSNGEPMVLALEFTSIEEVQPTSD